MAQWEKGASRTVLVVGAGIGGLATGACQAIEDSVVIADCLRSVRSVPAALAEYERRRYERTARMVRRSRAAGRVIQLRNPVLRGVRDMVARRLSVEQQLRQLESVLRIPTVD